MPSQHHHVSVVWSSGCGLLVAVLSMASFSCFAGSRRDGRGERLLKKTSHLLSMTRLSTQCFLLIRFLLQSECIWSKTELTVTCKNTHCRPAYLQCANALERKHVFCCFIHCTEWCSNMTLRHKIHLVGHFGFSLCYQCCVMRKMRQIKFTASTLPRRRFRIDS